MRRKRKTESSLFILCSVGVKGDKGSCLSYMWCIGVTCDKANSLVLVYGWIRVGTNLAFLSACRVFWHRPISQSSGSAKSG